MSEILGSGGSLWGVLGGMVNVEVEIVLGCGVGVRGVLMEVGEFALVLDGVDGGDEQMVVSREAVLGVRYVVEQAGLMG